MKPQGFVLFLWRYQNCNAVKEMKNRAMCCSCVGTKNCNAVKKVKQESSVLFLWRYQNCNAVKEMKNGAMCCSCGGAKTATASEMKPESSVLFLWRCQNCNGVRDETRELCVVLVAVPKPQRRQRSKTTELCCSCGGIKTEAPSKR